MKNKKERVVLEPAKEETKNFEAGSPLSPVVLHHREVKETVRAPTQKTFQLAPGMMVIYEVRPNETIPTSRGPVPGDKWLDEQLRRITSQEGRHGYKLNNMVIVNRVADDGKT
jgi:hypothetical protein